MEQEVVPLIRHLSFFLAAGILVVASLPLFAAVFATVHGVVHDSEHRPIVGAEVTLQASNSEFVLRATTDAEGAFELQQTPIGVYRLTVTAPGFESVTEALAVASGTNPVLHIPLAVGDRKSVV